MLSCYDVLVEYNECFLSPYIQDIDNLVVSEKCTILEFKSGVVTSRKPPPVQQVLHTINKYNDTHLMCHNWLGKIKVNFPFCHIISNLTSLLCSDHVHMTQLCIPLLLTTTRPSEVKFPLIMNIIYIL